MQIIVKELKVRFLAKHEKTKQKKFNNIGYKIEYDENVLDFILEKIKDESEFGARPIMRAIQDNIEDKITDTLLENTYNEGYVFKISCCSDLSEIKVA